MKDPFNRENCNIIRKELLIKQKGKPKRQDDPKRIA